MSLYFIANNLVFATGMVGAIVSLMAAWLSFDANRLRHDAYVIARGVGFSLCAIGYLLRALALGDVFSYLAVIIFIAGLLGILASFFKKTELVVHAIIIIPSFSILSQEIYGLIAILFVLVSYLSWRQLKREQNRTWLPLAISFAILALSSIISIYVSDSDQTNPLFLFKLVIEAIAFTFIAYWVWQFMRMRINESMAMISVAVTFTLATVVTLAFSTILIGRVTAETGRNLITDVKVLDFSVQTLKESSLAKAEVIAADTDVALAVTENDFASLYELSESLLEKHNLGFLTIVDGEGDVLVRANALSRRGDNLSSERAVEEALDNKSFSTIEESPVEGLSIRAGAPIISKGKVVGVVLAGYQLDNAFVDGMKRVTGLEMFIYKDDISISGTAFAADGTERLIGVKVEGEIRKDVLGEGKSALSEVTMYGEPFQASYAPLRNEDGKVVGMLSAAKRQQEIINVANATNRLTLITVLLIILILFVPVYSLAKWTRSNIA